MKRALPFFLFFACHLYAEPTIVHYSEKGAYLAPVIELGPSGTAVYDFIVHDFDQDEINEIGLIREHSDYPFGIAVYEEDKYEYTFTGPEELIPADDLPRELRNKPVSKISNHPLFKFAIVYTGVKGVEIYLLNSRFETIKHLTTIRGYDTTGSGEWNGHAHCRGLYDVNKDGFADIILAFNSGADATPRCILAIDIQTNEILFKWDFAPMPEYVELVDLKNDGNPIIFATLTGAGHGEFFGPFLRNESYLALFQPDGTLIKSWEHAGPNTRINYIVADMNRDTITDIIALYWASSQNGVETPNIIRVIDGKTLNEVCVHDAGNTKKYQKILKLNSRSSEFPLLIADNNAMNMEILSYHTDIPAFFIKRKLKSPQSTANLLQTFDFNRDGEDEFIVQSIAKKEFQIFDQSFNMLGRAQYGEGSVRNEYTQIHYSTSFDGVSLYFINNQRLKRADFPTDKLFPPPVLNFAVFGIPLELYKIYFILFTLIGSGTLVFLFIFIIQHRRISSLIDSDHIAAVLVNKSGKIEWANGAMLQLVGMNRRVRGTTCSDLFSGRSLAPILPHYELFNKSDQSSYQQTLTIHNQNGKKQFVIEFSRVNGRVQIIFLEQAPSSQEQLKVWAEMAQRLVHKAKTPLGAMLLSVQRMQRVMSKDEQVQQQYSSYLQTMGSEIERIRTNINEFLRFSRLKPAQLETHSIDKLLHEVYTQAQRNHVGKAEIQYEGLDQDIHIFVDAGQLTEALMNFIDNAVQAGKQDKAHVLINTAYQKQTVQFGVDKICIEISDDGVGIAREKMENLFKPGFTTKPGGSGMGLLIAKTLIEQNDGELSIFSRENIGTTITLLFPVTREIKTKETTT